MALPDVPWSDVAGLARPLRFLDGLLRTGRLPTGLLLHGARGCGKKTLASAFISRLQCVTDGADRCGTCKSCTLMRIGQHPDVSFVAPLDGKAAISIAQIRDLKEWFALSAFQSERRVAFIDAAHDLTLEAQNALLKILEEPPGSGLLVLSSSQPSGLLETIHSRVQSVFLGPVSCSDSIERVAALAEVGRDAATAALLAAEGSIGLAVTRLGDDLTDRAQAAAQALLDIRVMPFGMAEQQLKGPDGKRLPLSDVREFLRAVFREAMAMLRPPFPHEDPALSYLSEIDDCYRSELIELLVESRQRIGANVSPRLVLERGKILCQRTLSAARGAQRLS